MAADHARSAPGPFWGRLSLRRPSEEVWPTAGQLARRVGFCSNRGICLRHSQRGGHDVGTHRGVSTGLCR